LHPDSRGQLSGLSAGVRGRTLHIHAASLPPNILSATYFNHLAAAPYAGLFCRDLPAAAPALIEWLKKNRRKGERNF